MLLWGTQQILGSTSHWEINQIANSLPQGSCLINVKVSNVTHSIILKYLKKGIACLLLFIYLLRESKFISITGCRFSPPQPSFQVWGPWSFGRFNLEATAAVGPQVRECAGDTQIVRPAPHR